MKNLYVLISISALFLVSAGCVENGSGNGSPTAAFTANPSSGEAPLRVNFDASGSTDPDGDDLTFTWDFGDGGSGAGQSFIYTYDNDGSYTVTLTVTDTEGNADSASLTITVGADSPSGDTYYVSTGGDDSANGSASNPWRTLQHAADSLTPGDKVIINAGTYNTGFEMNTSGTANSPVTFEANGTVIIDGSASDRDIVFIEDADYIILDGLKIQNAERAAIRLSYSHHVTIRNCELANNGKWGVFTDFSDYTTIEDCRAYGSQDEHGIYISNSSDNAVIRRNRCYNNAACGIQINADPSMGGDGISSDCEIDSNICYNNGSLGGAAINLASVRNTKITNNVLYNNLAGGIAAWDDGQGLQWGSKNLEIYNNTIYFASGRGRWCISLKNGSTGANIYNNILSGGSKGSIEFDTNSVGGLESDYNALYSLNMQEYVLNDSTDTTYSLAEWQNNGHGQRSFVAAATALLVNIPGGNPALKTGSTAIDAGRTVDLDHDYEGDTRPSGGAFDVGADED